MILAGVLKEGVASGWMRIPGAETPEEWQALFHKSCGGHLSRKPELDQDGALAFLHEDPHPQIFLVKVETPQLPLPDPRLRGDETEMPWVPEELPWLETQTPPANHVPDEEHPIIPKLDVGAHLGRS